MGDNELSLTGKILTILPTNIENRQLDVTKITSQGNYRLMTNKIPAAKLTIQTESGTQEIIFPHLFSEVERDFWTNSNVDYLLEKSGWYDGGYGEDNRHYKLTHKEKQFELEYMVRRNLNFELPEFKFKYRFD